MSIGRQSRIKEVWRHPLGHNLLCVMLRHTGRSERWLTGPFMANMPLHMLDRFAGPGFADMVVEMTGHEPEHVVRAEQVNTVWWKEAVFYQIFLPSFMDSNGDGVGDIGGVIRRLPYLEKLGVDVLWLSHVLDVDARRTAGVRSYRAVSGDAGDVADVKRLVRRAHERGMRVMMGLDISATSDEHPWFGSALGGDEKGYYILRPGTPDAPPNNWIRGGGNPVWGWYADAGVWALHIGGRHLMDLDWDNAAVRSAMAEVLRFWRDIGMDGFFLGPVDTLSKSGYGNASPAGVALGACGYEKFAYGPRLHRYLRELRCAAGAQDVLLCGEVPNVDTEMAKLFCGCGRQELDMVFDHGAVAGRGRPGALEGSITLPKLKQVYIRWMEAYGPECWVPLVFETAEMPRMAGRLGTAPVYRTVLAKLLGTLLLTLRGSPVIYQGEELGIPGRHTAPAEAHRENPEGKDAEAQADLARSPMPWNNGIYAGFSGTKPWARLPDGAERLNAAMQMEDAASVWHHYQSLIALRKKHACLVYGSFKPVFAQNRRLFCYFRILNNHKWYVEINLTEREVARPTRISRSQKLVLSNYDMPGRALRPYEANVYQCEGDKGVPSGSGI